MEFFTTRLRSLCAVLVVLALVGLASAQQTGEEAPPSLQSVILKLNPDMKLSPDGNLSFYQAMKDVRLILLPNLDMAVIEVPADWDFEMLAEVLEQDPMVEYAMPDTSRIIIDTDIENTVNHQAVVGSQAAAMANRGRVIPNDPEFARLWHLDNPNNDADIDAPEGWTYTTGSTEVVVAVIDSGIDYLHPDLRNNIWINQAETKGQVGVDDDGNGYIDDVHGWNACDDNGDPWDLNGHGTRVSSAVAAQGNNGYQITGAAWHARVMPLKASACTSSRSGFSQIIKSLEYILTMKKLGVPIRVINMSLGISAPLEIWRESVKRLHAAGILISTSSGNRNIIITSRDDVLVDKFYDNVIVVGATNRNKNRSGFSDHNRDVVDLGAPGENILALRTGHFLAGNAHVTGKFSQAVFSSAASDQGNQWTLGSGWIQDGAQWRFEVRPSRGLPGLSRAGNGGSATLESAVTLESPRIDLSAYKDTRLLLTFSPYRKLQAASINASNSYRYVIQARIGHDAWSTLEESRSDYTGSASLPILIPTHFYQNNFQFRFCLGETGADAGNRCVWRNKSDSLLNNLIDGSISASLLLRVGRVAIYDPAALYENSPAALRSSFGTSYSSPLVAGAAALLFAYNPAFSYRVVKRAILQGVKKVTGLENYFITGGILSVKGAFEALEEIPAISFAQTEVDVVEGTTKTVTILVDPINPDEIIVQLTAAATAIGVGFPSTLTIPSEQPSVQFDIGVAENDRKQNESVKLVLGLEEANLPVFVGSTDVLTVNVIDNDQANSIGFTNNMLVLKEGTTQTITMVGNELASTAQVTVFIAGEGMGQITLSDPHADLPSSSTQLSIVLPGGSTRYTIMAASPEDNKPEREQTYILQLRLTKHEPVNTPLLIVSRMAITIPENDLSVLAFAGQTNVVLAEGGTRQLTITAKPAPRENVMVRLRTEGSGADDVQISPDSFVLKPGQSINTVTVTVRDDSTPEPEEYAVIALELENPEDVFAKIDENGGQLVITIPNNDILIQVFTDRNVIPEGDRAAILVQSMSVTDPVAVRFASSNNKGRLSDQRVELSGAAPAAIIHLSVADDDANPQPQFSNVLFNVSLSGPSHLSFNRTSLSYTIPPNDLTASLDKPAVLSARGETDKVQLSITGLQADKSFIVSSDDPNLVVPSGIITADQDALSVTVGLLPAAVVDRETLILPLQISYLDALRPTAKPSAQISVGHYAHTCAVKTDNTVACWGFSGNGQADPPPGHFLSVSGGYFHTCAVRIDNTAACWGSNFLGGATPPQGEAFLAVSAGIRKACGIRTDGAARCWGNNSVGQADPPQAKVFLSISSGNSHTCGIRTDNTVVCWGNNSVGQADPPPGQFVAISSGQDHTCGIRTDGAARCWGNNNDGQAAAPSSETFLAIGSGDTHTCAVRTDNREAVCWGSNRDGKAAPPPGETFLAVSAGQNHTCAVKMDGSPVCWGENTGGETTPPPDLQVRINPDTPWLFEKTDSVDSAAELRLKFEPASVAIHTDRSIIPEDSIAAIVMAETTTALNHAVTISPQLTASDYADAKFSSTSVQLSNRAPRSIVFLSLLGNQGLQADERTITVSFSTTDSRVLIEPRALSYTIPPNDLTASLDKPAVLSARGETDKVQLSITGLQADKSFIVSSDDPNLVVPSGIITADQDALSVTVGLLPAAVVSVGTLILPLQISYLDALRPTARPSAQISVGHYAHACAVKTDNTAACWGFSGNGQADPPPGQFLSVSGGYFHTCAVRIDNTAACWGFSGTGQADPPPGEIFLAISSGQSHTCGIRTDGAARCWGNNNNGQADPPQAEAFLSMSSGNSHTCGIKADNTVVCWGSNLSGQTDSPESETFLAISSGQSHTCGIRTDGAARCWGNNNDGQAAAPQAETFLAIGSGDTHTCGIKTDNQEAVCWGSNRDGEAAPPSGETFLAIDSGQNHTCAVKMDGNPVCWGENASGITTPPPDMQVRINSNTPWLFEKTDDVEDAVVVPNQGAPVVAFAQKSVDIVEGATRTMTILITPSSVDDLVVRLTSDGSSASRIIFPESLVIPRGRSLMLFEASVAEDKIQWNESVNIRLSLAQADAFAAIGSSSVLTVNVIDNDQINSIGFANNVLVLKEGATQAVTIVSKELASTAQVTVFIAEGNMGQIALSDPHADPPAPSTQLSIVLPSGSTRYAIIAASPADSVSGHRQTSIIQLELAEHKPINMPTLTVPRIAVTVQSSDVRLKIKVYLEGALSSGGAQNVPASFSKN